MGNNYSRRDLARLVEAKFGAQQQQRQISSANNASAAVAARSGAAAAASSAATVVPSAAAAAPDLIALARAAGLWAQTTTNSDLRRAADVRRDKLRVVREFFAFTNKELPDVTPLDVQDWQLWLESRPKPLKARTIYLYSAHLSSFFEWLRRQPEFKPYFPANPVRAAFPKCPNAYESDGTRSLTDESFARLWAAIELAARREFDTVALRDYAIFQFFAATGARRSEILNLNLSDVELSARSGALIFYSRTKGGTRVGKTITDPEVRRALVKYLEGTNRRGDLGKPEPLWLAHDRAAAKRIARAGDALLLAPTNQPNRRESLPRPGARTDNRLTGHAFAARMKVYARAAGISRFHLHQLRHTFARLIHEKTRSVSQTQEALGHRNMKTTEVYVTRIKIKADEHSQAISDRFRPAAK